MCFIILLINLILLEEFVDHLGKEDGVKNQQHEIVGHKGYNPRNHSIPAYYGIDYSKSNQHQEHTKTGTCRMERGKKVQMPYGYPLPKRCQYHQLKHRKDSRNATSFVMQQTRIQQLVFRNHHRYASEHTDGEKAYQHVLTGLFLYFGLWHFLTITIPHRGLPDSDSQKQSLR